MPSHAKSLPDAQSGFTFPELLIATFIIVTAFLGILLSLIQGLELSEMAQNSTLALAAAKNKLTEIENTPFDQISATYNNTTYTIPDLAGRGVIYVTAVDAKLIEVTTSFSWQGKNGRVTGEDLDLDGQLDGPEDKNNNDLLDSPVKLTTLIFDTS